MPPSGSQQLPLLTVADFGAGLDHVAETYHNGKMFAAVHKAEPLRLILPGLGFAPTDPYTYVFVHGGKEATRFENAESATHEIPAAVLAYLLSNEFGGWLSGMRLRLCTCYGNLLRPDDARTVGQELAGLLPQAAIEGYHGLVIVEASPPQIRRGVSVQWDASGIPPGPVVVGLPGPWERIVP